MTTPVWLRGLEERRAIVTGAGRGIGRACALALAQAGAEVIAVARTEADLTSLEVEGGGRITAWQEDLTSDAFFERLEALAGLDILINNAGMNRPLRLEDVDVDTLDAMIALNIRAVYRASQSAARVMQRANRGGSIIHMSSQMGHVGAARRQGRALHAGPHHGDATAGAWGVRGKENGKGGRKGGAGL